MTTNLREKAESDLADTLEGEWGTPVVLTGPDGIVMSVSANDSTKPLVGRVDYNTRKLDPNTGEEKVVPNPVLTLRRSSLTRIPATGEKWFVRIPVSPEPGSLIRSFVATPTRAPEDGTTIGTITLYLQKAVQS